MDATRRLPMLPAALRRWGSHEQEMRRAQEDAVVKAAAVTYPPLARMRRRCRILNDAYEASENKPEVRTSIAQTVGHLRQLHSQLPSRLQPKSWILAMEYYDGWSVAARKNA